MAGDQGKRSTEYERLTERLLTLLARRSPVRTTRLDHNVRLRGRATEHQIDVLWDFDDSSSGAQRILFECRLYGDRLKQKDLLAFKGVVDDLDAPHLPVTGVMVTSSGYQSGAQAVAETYGIIILELREPTDADLAGRVLAIDVRAHMRLPVITNINVSPTEILTNENVAFEGPITSFHLETADGQRAGLGDCLLAEALNDLTGPPTPMHAVTRDFNPPAVLFLEGNPVARVRAVSADVGERLLDSDEIRMGGRESLAHLIKETLGGRRAWFTHAGKFHVTRD